MISFVLPTRDRPGALARTLRSLGGLDPERYACLGGGEVIVVDNGGDANVPYRLSNGFGVRLIRERENVGTAARNTGARSAVGAWLVMLDDDSEPVEAEGGGAGPEQHGLVDVVMDAPADVAAIGAEIFLPSSLHGDGPLAGRPRREAGGRPEVFVGCGALIRRDVFLEVGGYDAGFGYYAEEYDLCARLLLGGWRVTHDRRFRVAHHKVEHGRDMDRIVRMLVRNGGWVAARYTPESRREEAVRGVMDRCAFIAEKEGALAGYERGVRELEASLDAQVRTPMTVAQHDRFTGLAAARRAVALHRERGTLGDTARLVDAGKHAWCVRTALQEAGVAVIDDGDARVGGNAGADVPGVVGTLSPGPMWDALDIGAASGETVLAPWISDGSEAECGSGRVRV